MVHVAREMKRQGFSVPLLIGGATTSKVHTAVKIAPNYPHPVVYVPDASRAVGVVGALLSSGRGQAYAAEIAADYADVRARRLVGERRVERRGIADARARGLRTDWAAHPPETPREPGIHVIEDQDLAPLVERIDWGPFFRTWELAGAFPAILSDAVVGAQARSLYDDARAMLRQIVSEKWLVAKAVFGLLPANRVGDDVVVWTDESRREEWYTFHFLRQQNHKPEGQINQCLADFVPEPGVEGWIGCFAVTSGHGIEEHVSRFMADHDDYRAILLKALADRLAEAYAEHLHQRVRKEHWGYAPDESFTNAELIDERYRGIRPAPGYPACPDHTEKRTLFHLLGCEAKIGLQLTESMAMYPTAAVSGFYFGHPQAQYFGVGKLDRDQVVDYAARKGWTLEEAERWLGPNLGYEPAEATRDGAA